MEADSTPVRCFLSYAQQDELVLSFVEPFIRDLEHLAYTSSGRKLEIFHDKKSIGWGENAQTKIMTSIENALVFMPVVTRTYFDRPYCRQELLAFHNQAEALGVESLLLPVVLLGGSYLTDSSPDAAVRLIAPLQQRNLEDAWLEGPGSPTWKKMLLNLARELVERVEQAEKILAAKASVVRPVLDDDAPGLAEVTEALEQFTTDTEQFVGVAVEVMTGFTEILQDATAEFTGLTPNEVRHKLADFAVALQPGGEKLYQAGRRYDDRMIEIDRQLRQYVELVRQRGTADEQEDLRSGLKSAAESLDTLAEVEQQVEVLLESIRPAETVSAALRNSLRGFREGVIVIKNATIMLRSWPHIADTLDAA